MGVLDEEFRKKYPALFKEWGGPSTLRIRAVRTSLREAEKMACTSGGYEPTVIDFIRRCESEAQALEIIDFLEAKGEIEPDYAKRLRSQLERLGLRSFGKRKKPGYYYQIE